MDPSTCSSSNLVYPPGCLLVRRTAYEQAGGFDGRYLAEDWEFVVRLAPRWVRSFRLIASWPGIAGTCSTASGNRARNVRGARQVWAAVYHADHGAEGTRTRIRGESGAHTRRAPPRRNSAEARALVARGKVLPGMSRAADGVAHALLRHPPRIWITQGAKVRERESRSAALSRSAD